MLPKQAVREFQALILKLRGVQLSDKEAEEYAVAFIEGVKVIVNKKELDQDAEN